ncbi:MAG: periplasmic heavy metal sensor [Acidobacteriota bacterium]
MIKKVFGTAVVLALFSGVAMAQASSVSRSDEGSSVVIRRVGPGGGFMQGPGPSFIRMRTMGRMGHGPMSWFQRGGMGQWWKNPEIAQKIGLTDQQKQQLDKISQEGRLKMIDLRANLEKQRVILGPMLQTYHPDEAQVLAQVDKVSQARAAVEKGRIQNMLATRNVLSEEQWKKLQDARMEFHHTFRVRRFQRSGGGPMPPAPPKQ